MTKPRVGGHRSLEALARHLRRKHSYEPDLNTRDVDNRLRQLEIVHTTFHRQMAKVDHA